MKKDKLIQIILLGIIALTISNCSYDNPVSSSVEKQTTEAYYWNSGSFPVAVATNYTGDLICLTTASLNSVTRLYQVKQNSNYTWPASFTLNTSILYGIPSALRYKDTLYTFNYGTDQKVWFSKYNSVYPNGSSWTAIGTKTFSNDARGIIGVARFGNAITNPIVVFARDNNGYLYCLQQNANGSFPTTWTRIGTQTINHFYGVKIQPDNKIVVAASQLSDAKVVYTILTSISSYTPWAVMNATGPLAAGLQNDVIIGKNADGRLELFTTAADRTLYHCYQTAVNTNTWSAWSNYFYSGQTASILVDGQLAVANNLDGRQELFFKYYDASLNLKHIYQLAANGNWSTVEDFNSGTFVPGDNLAAGNYRDGRIFVTSWCQSVRKYLAQTAPNGIWSSVGTISGTPN